jgi:tRNA threonylcarbamoyladenosine biosynthesis protein TsaB
MLLALETANDQCSVVLYDGQSILAERIDHRSREQTRLILPMVDEVLAECNITLADIAVIAFSRGPGSFSGVRINAAVAQGLAWANDIPVVAVSTLQATAQAAWRQHQLAQVVAVIDARMKEVYAAAYTLNDSNVMQSVGVEQLTAYDALQLDLAQADQFALVGSGSGLVTASGFLATYQDVCANARDVALLGYTLWLAGEAVDAAQALPVYLRDNAWKKIADQQKPAQ